MHLLLLLAVFAQTKPIALADYYKIETVSSPAISPDGKQISYLKPKIIEAENPRHSELCIAAKCLTQIKASVSVPQWSPDGKLLGGRGYLPDPHTAPAVELFLLPRSGGEARQLTTLGVSVENIAWSPDSKSIAFVVNMHQFDEKTYQRTDLFTVTNEAKLERLTDDNHHYSNPAWSPDGKTIAVLRQKSFNPILANKRTQGSPIDIYSVPSTGGNLTNLTAAWDDLPATPIFSKDGKSVYFKANLRGTGHLYRLDLRSRTVEQITKRDRLLDGFDLNEDAGIIAYTATNPDTPVELFSAPLASPTKQTQITIQPTRWSLGKTGRISDPKRTGITGYSYGGFLTNWAIGHTNIFKAATTGAGPTNWISNYGTGDIPRTKETEFFGPPWSETGNATMIKYSPITYAANIKTPTLFIHGEADLRVPTAQAEELYTALKKQNVPARFVRYPGEYHGGWSPWNSVHRYQQEMNWWAQYLQ